MERIEKLSELEDDYKCLCAILLYLALTRNDAGASGNERKHEAAVKAAENAVNLVGEKIKAIKGDG